MEFFASKIGRGGKLRLKHVNCVILFIIIIIDIIEHFQINIFKLKYLIMS